MQHRGATAGAEVHRCLGSFGGLQREREVLCAWSGDSVPVRHIFLGIGSSSSVIDQPQPVSRVVCTSTYNYGSYSEYISVLCSVLSSRPGIWGPE